MKIKYCDIIIVLVHHNVQYKPGSHISMNNKGGHNPVQPKHCTCPIVQYKHHMRNVHNIPNNTATGNYVNYFNDFLIPVITNITAWVLPGVSGYSKEAWAYNSS